MQGDDPDSDVREYPTGEGWNARASRIAPLIDGEEYFAAVRLSMIRAERSILIVGWELHSEVELLRGEEADRAAEADGYPVVLADLLQRLVDDNDDLRIHLLIWTGAALFALEREHLPRMKRPWESHPRIRLEWAEDTPPLASHHQKFVVIDDRVVFLGGMDLTKSRWDSHKHRVQDPRRRKPGLLPSLSDPYHDTMLVCEGEVATEIGELGRERWGQATSELLDAPDAAGEADLWPPKIEPALRDLRIHLACTRPEYNGRSEIRDVESAFVRQFKAAERLIYIETQYLTATSLVDILIERLEDPDGPEIVLVLPYGCPGTLQSMALDHQRDRLIERLRSADPGGRLGIYWPTLAGGSNEKPYETSVYVHAKVTVIDDRLLRIGSANLNNRSLGLDTELDGWVEADEDDERASGAIASFRRRSLSYLLGSEPDTIRDAEREHGSLVAAIDRLRDGEQTLWPFEHTAPQFATAVRLDIQLADPDRPLNRQDAERVLEAIADQIGFRGRGRRVYNRFVGGLRRHKALIATCAAVLVVVWALWLTPAGEVVGSADVEAMMASVRGSPFGIPGVLALLVALGSVGAPITLLIAAAGAVIGSWLAAPLIAAAVMAASAAGYAFGRYAPSRLRERLLQGRMEELAERINRNGVLAVAVLRNIPVAPFAVMNAALGFSGIKWMPYLLGTLIGMLPGVILLSLFGHGLIQMVAEPTIESVLKLAAIALGVILVALGTQKLLGRLAPGIIDESEDAE